jgi:hypothetical protein
MVTVKIRLVILLAWYPTCLVHGFGPFAAHKASLSLVPTYSSTNSASRLASAAFDWDVWQIGQGRSPDRQDWLRGTCFEEYWSTLSPIVSSAKGNSSTIAVDGHLFSGRMAILDYLIRDWEEMSDKGSTTMRMLWGSPFSEGHWLWAYGAQLDWQHRSGRLAVGQHAAGCDDAKPSHTATTHFLLMMRFPLNLGGPT